MDTNTRVVLAKRPTGEATADCFEVVTETVAPLEDGEVRVATEAISVDAGTRTTLKGDGFHHQVAPGDTILAGAVGRVVASAHPDFNQGQAVRGRFGAQTLATVTADSLEALDDSIAEPRSFLGVLGGSTGITAWIGMRCVAKPKPGDVVVVSAAAGAVGSVVAQIAKRDGGHVIGIAGGPEKKAFLTERLGLDAAIDYKNEEVGERLRELAPNGVNVFFDNVGGPVLDAVLDNIAMRSKVVICGAISQYDDMDNVTGPSMYLRLAERQSVMEGFAYFHFPESIPKAAAELADWLAKDEIVFEETVLEGIERYPEALSFMFNGGNIGKLLVTP